MPSTSRARSARSARRARKASAAPAAAASPVLRIAQELRRWTGTVLGIAASATDLSLNLVRARAPRQQAAIEKAGSMLRQAREAAGITTQELGRAIDITDPDLLDQAELGKAALPFEVILRLAGVLGRHDPVTFVMKLARSYYPQLWQALDELGIGRLAVQAGRERELANIYRGNDAARRLTDEDFTAVLGFVKTGFDLAVSFHSAATGEDRSPRAKPRKR